MCSDRRCPLTWTYVFGLNQHVLCTLYIAFVIRRITRRLMKNQTSLRNKGFGCWSLMLCFRTSGVVQCICGASYLYVFEVFFSFRSRKIRLDNTIIIPYQLPSIALYFSQRIHVMSCCPIVSPCLIV